jgi:hypothetical protein
MLDPATFIAILVGICNLLLFWRTITKKDTVTPSQFAELKNETAHKAPNSDLVGVKTSIDNLITKIDDNKKEVETKIKEIRDQRKEDRNETQKAIKEVNKTILEYLRE